MLSVDAHHPASGMSWESTGRTASSFFFLIKKEPFALTKAVQLKPYVPAETLKACALIGLHLLASCGVFSPFQGSVVRGTLCGKKKYIYSECRALEVIGAGLVKRGGGALSRGLGTLGE